jgi:hypothetical protein
MKKTTIIAATAFLVILTASGCFENPFERGLPAEGGGEEINREVSYSSEVYPILNAGTSTIPLQASCCKKAPAKPRMEAQR